LKSGWQRPARLAHRPDRAKSLRLPSWRWSARPGEAGALSAAIPSCRASCWTSGRSG